MKNIKKALDYERDKTSEYYPLENPTIMNFRKIIFSLVALLAFTNLANAQTDKEKALTKAQEAIELMDNGQIKESIKLLKEAEKLDPERFDYPYEIAYAHYIDKDYKSSIKILEKIKSHKDASERLFQLLGNSYDILGKTQKAFDSYDLGLKKFPNSGMMYLEKGNVYWAQKKYNEALSFYEKGIEIDPTFPSNYYRATLIYLSTSEEIWGMIYGEIFMNLERNSKRTAEISKLLYDTYKSEITFTSDSSYTVSFSQSSVITIESLQDTSALKLPFGVVAYEPTLMISILNEKEIDIHSLDRIRQNFVTLYFGNSNSINYPNALFDYQKKVKDAGQMEAYNHWILMKGDVDGFNKWNAENPEKWQAFVEWFSNNGLILNSENKFFKDQY